MIIDITLTIVGSDNYSCLSVALQDQIRDIKIVRFVIERVGIVQIKFILLDFQYRPRLKLYIKKIIYLDHAQLLSHFTHNYFETTLKSCCFPPYYF